MSKLFISHSSSDKKFVKKLAKDLKAQGHEVWLDEWEIKVGDCILKKVEEGVVESDYVIIVLTRNSVSSTWVEKEWRTKYWEEIQNNEVFVLPILKEECEIPPLLKTKKYADFTGNYSVGLINLANSLGYKNKSMEVESLNGQENLTEEIRNLLLKVQSGNKLSECISECLSISNKLDDESLEHFCTVELKGIKRGENYPEFLHRRIDAYASFNQINTEFVGWGGDLSQAINMMSRNQDEFFQTKFMIWQPILELEEMAQQEGLDRKLLSFTLKAKHLDADISNPNRPVHIYAKASSIESIVTQTRNKLTELLIDRT